MDEYFFVCIYKKGGKSIAHAISFTDDFKATVEEQRATAIETISVTKSIKSKYQIIFNQYCTSMLSYIELLPFLASVSPIVGQQIRLVSFSKFVTENALTESSLGENKVYKLHRDHLAKINEISESGSRASEAGRQIPKMLVTGIVSTYEHHISHLIRQILIDNPAKIEYSSRTISVKEVFDSKNLEEFKEAILDLEIDIVMRNGFEEQINWIESAAKIVEKISKEFDDWATLVEIFERRNLFTHTNGIINNRYLEKGEKLNFLSKSKKEKGTELLAEPKYLKRSLELVCEFGVKLIQVCWRKIEQDQQSVQDDVLGDFGFELVERGNYRLASRILEFFFSLRGSKDRERYLICLINLANAYKLDGRDKEAEKTLSKEDFSVASDVFKICAASVRSETLEVVRLMKKMGRDVEFGERAYRDWPVFFHVRDNEEFKAAYKGIFERDYVASPKRRREILRDFAGSEGDENSSSRREITLVPSSSLNVETNPAPKEPLDNNRKSRITDVIESPMKTGRSKKLHITRSRELGTEKKTVTSKRATGKRSGRKNREV